MSVDRVVIKHSIYMVCLLFFSCKSSSVKKEAVTYKIASEVKKVEKIDEIIPDDVAYDNSHEKTFSIAHPLAAGELSPLPLLDLSSNILLRDLKKHQRVWVYLRFSIYLKLI